MSQENLNLAATDELIAEARSLMPGRMPSDMSSVMAAIITFAEFISLWVGRIVCWLIMPVMFSMVYEIVARYAFTAPTVWAYDTSRMLYGAHFTLGAAYALSRGIHIRADFIYRNWSAKTQAYIDLALYILFYFPGLVVFLWSSIDFALAAWLREERGMDTAWMPLVYPIKSVLPTSIAFLLLQGVSEVLKCVYAIQKGRWPSDS